MAKIINGAQISADIKNEIKQETAELERTKGVKPGLSVILVGENPASKVYVANKQKGCAEVGFLSEEIKMPDTVSTADILKEIDLSLIHI